MTRETGLVTRHSFSFGPHYDAANTGLGPLVCHDDHLLAGGAGFPEHGHSDLEIVTWVLSGTLEHTGDDGTTHRLEPGTLQVQSAGSGIRHEERAAEGGPARFVQAWLRPDDGASTDPATSRARPALAPGTLTVVAGPDAGLPLRVAGATLSAAALGAGDEVDLPRAPVLHVFVATGALARSSLAQPLEAGDAFRVVDHPAPLRVTAAAPTTLLVWSFRR